MINAMIYGNSNKKMFIQRALDLEKLLKQKSLFLLGPRQTGKTYLIRNTLSSYRTYNLLETETFVKLSRSPQRIREEWRENERIIIIDEIQKLPCLLNEVHLLIEEKGIHFLLTGSSARKLRKGGVNLLGGRAWMRPFHPFSYIELKGHFHLDRAINYGLIPSIYLSQNPQEDIQSYVGTYLQEEVAAEGLTRNVPAFSRFLEVAALSNGKLINYTNIANDSQVARSTVQEYFQILKDTLMGFELPAWKASKKRKPIQTSKFYFFDGSIVRFLQNRNIIKEGSPEFGEFFEQYIFHELKTYCDYSGRHDLCYWRSTSGFEVDFILADQTAVEVKAGKTIGMNDLRGLKALSEEKKLKNFILVCLEKTERKINNIHILPWKTFVERLWTGKYS